MVAAGNNRSRAELRKKPRRPFHQIARIAIDRETAPIACSVADISELGARLTLESHAELPEKFVLLLSPKGHPRRHCRLVWRNELTVGVEFPQVDDH